MKINAGGSSRPSGRCDVQLTRDLGVLKPPPGWTLNNWLRYRRRELPREFTMKFLGRTVGIASLDAQLKGSVYRLPELPFERLARLKQLLADNVSHFELAREFGGLVTDYGVLSKRFVTDAGVAFIVDAFQNLTEVENFKFHGYGTGTTAENANQTALVTELTTQYVADNTRPTGSQTEASANVYRTVGTLSPDTGGTIAVTEHGVFSAASAGTLLDRSVFSAVNLVAGSDSLQTTYDLTVASGG